MSEPTILTVEQTSHTKRMNGFIRLNCLMNLISVGDLCDSHELLRARMVEEGRNAIAAEITVEQLRTQLTERTRERDEWQALAITPKGSDALIAQRDAATARAEVDKVDALFEGVLRLIPELQAERAKRVAS